MVYATVFFILVVMNLMSTYRSEFLYINQADFQGTFFYGVVRWLSNLSLDPTFNYISVYVFWVSLAIVTFFVIERVIHCEKEFVRDISIRNYVWPEGSNKNKPLEDFFEQVAFRFTILILMLIYIIRVTPSMGEWWKAHHNGANILVYGELLLLEFLFAQFFVILLRLFLLKDRVIAIN